MSEMPTLRPMTAGDILDQAIWLYRKNFVTLVGIIAVVAVPVLLVNVAVTLLTFPSNPFAFSRNPFLSAASSPDPASFLVYYGVTIALGLISAIAGVFQNAAVTVVVSERYLGRAITMRQAYGRALSRWLSLLIAAILMGLVYLGALTVILLPLIGIGAAAFVGASSSSGASVIGALLFPCLCFSIIPVIVVGLYLYTHWAFTTQAIMLENQNSTGGMRRSWRLVRGTFWRVLGIVIALALLVYFMALTPSGLINFLAFALPSLTVAAVVSSVLATAIQILVNPIQFAALTMLYYDLRIRKEGYDLEVLSQSLAPLPSTPGLSGAPA